MLLEHAVLLKQLSTPQYPLHLCNMRIIIITTHAIMTSRFTELVLTQTKFSWKVIAMSSPKCALMECGSIIKEVLLKKANMQESF